MLGIDNSPAALTLAREWLQLGGVDAGLIRADMRRPLPLPDACVDGLLSTQVIHHALLATVRGTARELSRILRPGGLLFVSVPLGTEPEEPFVEVEPATFVPTTGPEQGLPHHIFTPQTLYELFPAFKLLELDEIGGRILTLLAVRLPATQGPEDAGREP
jgi:SAM-dependent methyltransferase